MTSIIEASFISRRWRNLWHFIPILEFYLDDSEEHPHSDDSEEHPHSDDSDHLRLINTITQVLLNRPKSIPFTVFRLAIRYFPNHRHRSLISSWLRYALDCGVQDLSLTFDGEGNDDESINLYDFHFSDLRNKPVKCLRLADCEIVMPSCVSFRFNSLRKLNLARVNVADELLTNLISMCVNLEELCLMFFHGVRNFKICSESLKVLKLLHYYGGAIRKQSSVEICTPNLSKIKVSNFFVAAYTGDLSSVNEAKLSFSNGLKNFEECLGSAMNLLSGVEILKLKAKFPRFILSKFKSSESFQLTRLKHLELVVSTLHDVLGVSLLLNRSPALETLVFVNVREGGLESDLDGDDDEHEEDGACSFFGKLADTTRFLDEKNPSPEMRFYIPSLREVKMRGFRNTMNEHMILLLLEKHRVVLNKVVVLPAVHGEATVVLDPTSKDLHNFWLRCMTDKLAKAKDEVCRLQEESSEDEEEEGEN